MKGYSANVLKISKSFTLIFGNAYTDSLEENKCFEFLFRFICKISNVTNRTYLHSVMFAMKFNAMFFPIPNFPNADVGGYDIALRYMSREISFLYSRSCRICIRYEEKEREKERERWILFLAHLLRS